MALVQKVPPVKGRPYVCNFCRSGTHHYCPQGIRNGDGSIIPCTCDGDECKAGSLRCTECRNTHPDEVNATTWRCFDKDACESSVRSRLAADPRIQNIERIRSKVMAEKADEKSTTREKVVKVGKCLVTGEPTKGGKFKPGMDSRYVSMRVQEVVAGDVTEADARERINSEVGSTALLAKFDKSLGLRREADKKAAEAAKAKEQAAAATKASEAATKG